MTRFYKILSTLVAVSFFVMYFILSYYNRLVFDDFSVVASALKLGPFKGALYWYTNLDGCLITVFIHQYGELFLFIINKVYPFNYLTILLLGGSTFLFLRAWTTKFQIGLSNTTVFISAAIFTSLFYLISPQITQCFYWISSIIPYLYPVIFLTLGLAFLAWADKPVYLTLSCIFFFLFGLTRIHFVFPVFAAISAYPFFYFLFTRQVKRGAIIIAGCILAGMVISVGAPGNYKRQVMEASLKMSDPSFSYSITATVGRVASKLFHTNLRYFIVAFPVFLFAGASLANKKTGLDEKINKALHFGIIKLILLSLLLIGALFLLNAVIMWVAVKNCYYVDRVWVHFFLAVLIIEFVIAFLIGYKYARYSNMFLPVAGLAMVYLLHVFVKSAATIQPFEREYVRAYDNNIELMKEEKARNRREVLYVHPMPDNTGLIQGWQVKSDTGFWVNQCLAYDYALPFAIADSTQKIRR